LRRADDRVREGRAVMAGGGSNTKTDLTDDQLKAYKNSELWTEVKKKHAKPT
jgi:hypothetical protein